MKYVVLLLLMGKQKKLLYYAISGKVFKLIWFRTNQKKIE